MNKLINVFAQKIPIYQKDPVLFAREVCRFEPDEWQASVLNDIATSTKVSVRSGHGVGKTGVESIVILWFLLCFRFPKIIVTAPTRQQLNDILWSEIEKWRSKSPLLRTLLVWTKTHVYMKGYEKRWFAVAKTASAPENMQGFHEDNMLIVVDEASGVADDIMEAILATLSGENNKLLMCANPTKITGTFFDSHNRDRAMYKCHKVSSLDSTRTNKENIESFIRKYGEQSNVVRVRVYGEFPVQEDDVFIPLHYVENSVNADYTSTEIKSIHIGCDVARFGDDKTVIGYKVNEKVEWYKKVQSQDTMLTADDIVKLSEILIKKHNWKSYIPIKIDAGGIGGGVIDRLRQLKKLNSSRFWWMDIIEVNFGQRIKHKHYHDSTTYMMSVVKNLLSPFDENGNKKPIELILPNDSDLIAQLSGRKYVITDASKVRIESKEAMKKRGQPSPDEADCVLLLCLPITPTQKGIKNSE